ncbi:hypothetical protein Dimus_016795 [Dionaea muscipula]
MVGATKEKGDVDMVLENGKVDVRDQGLIGDGCSAVGERAIEKKGVAKQRWEPRIGGRVPCRGKRTRNAGHGVLHKYRISAPDHSQHRRYILNSTSTGSQPQAHNYLDGPNIIKISPLLTRLILPQAGNRDSTTPAPNPRPQLLSAQRSFFVLLRSPPQQPQHRRRLLSSHPSPASCLLPQSAS